MRNSNSRRGQTSITHLMSFSLPPRPQDHRNTMLRGTRRGNIYGIGSGHHSSDKARYVAYRLSLGCSNCVRYIHANYRFIVKPTGDYKQQAINADLPLEWNDVLQILASSVSQDASCPICLSHPVAPRMAKCGHIFCLPCLIRYMHSTDDETAVPEKRARWKKCPICWDTVFMAETRPVRWYTGQESPAPKEGDDVVLRLVMRQPGSTLALPRDGAETLGKFEDIPWYFAAEVTDYARMMKGSEEYMQEQYDTEIVELRQQENEDELMFGEEPEWTRKAVKAVHEAKDKLKGIGNRPPMPKKPTEKAPIRQPIIFNPINLDAPETFYIQHTSQSDLSFAISAESGVGPALVAPPQDAFTQPPTAPKAHLSPRKQPRHGQNDAHHPDAPYFFYQSLLHYYLAPLDIRILKSAFGNFVSFPSTLLPRVERVSTGHIMDEDLRKRTKYLSHLPYGCEVGFLECNWTDCVAPEVLEHFKDDIEKRRKKNQDKENREEKERQRAERAEDDLRWASARRKRPTSPLDNYSTDAFPIEMPPNFDSSSSSPPWPSRQGSSFATLASPSTSPSAPKTVWGTTMITPSSPNTRVREPDSGADDGWLQTWEQELIAENELIAQVQAASLNGESSVVKPNVSAGQGKKKKAKKITLMSTTARRAA